MRQVAKQTGGWMITDEGGDYWVGEEVGTVTHYLERWGYSDYVDSLLDDMATAPVGSAWQFPEGS